MAANEKLRVLYVGPLDNTGYGQAGQHLVRALDAVGVPVVCRRLWLSGPCQQHPRVQELMQRPAGHVTHCIQHSLPTHFQINRSWKNIAYFAWETTELPLAWSRRLQLFDSVWCISQQQAGTTYDAGVQNIMVVPHPCDWSRYQERPAPLPFLEQLPGYIFYGVGEWNRRKNWSSLLRAYHTEFSPTEPVHLVIKTSIPGMSAEAAREKVQSFCAEVRRGLKLRAEHQYRQEIIITEHLSERDLLSLHASGDCYVTTSFGEACGLPTLDAAALGKPIIAPNWGGFADYLSDSNAFLIDGRLEPAYGATDSSPDFYTARGQWFSVDICQLQKVMRSIVSQPGEAISKGQQARCLLEMFDYQKVGEHMKNLLMLV